MTISSCTFKPKNTCNNLGLLLLTIPRAKNPEGLNLGDIFSRETTDYAKNKGCVLAEKCE